MTKCRDHQHFRDFDRRIHMKILANWWDLTPTVGQILSEEVCGAFGTIYRSESGVSRRSRAREPCRAPESTSARHRRARYGQRADCRAASPSVFAMGRAVDYHELCRVA